ncbi:hypothetical protein DFH08DRAFT_1078446 [Mycena albidolilacea]|uniref:C2H2-type domain-containing protein n=1 Tax=Mycena albidolilacea TaxID=1033008 RepID=A0AAD7A7W9_9AGAR|nr:hypothetical protein DFH08DRAFT_1078446 [Mycena albidolilacea]
MTFHSQPAPIVLPSIRDMFPEHLPMQRAVIVAAHPPRAVLRSHWTRPTQRPHSFSFDVLKSHPRGSSLYHIASSRPSRADRSPVARAQPDSIPNSGSSSRSNLSNGKRPHSSSGSSDEDAEIDDAEDGDDGDEGSLEGKKHVCPTCAKCFNRPSSLRIHVNTHTGATPFRCPYPSCGRAFNVNSNMRRHYRNHANSALTTPKSPPASDNSTPTSPSSLSFNSKSPRVVTSVASLSVPLSPSSPPSPSWSVPSSSAPSPITPASALASGLSAFAFPPSPAPFERSPHLWGLVPMSKWNSNDSNPYLHRSSPSHDREDAARALLDVRNERHR